MSTRTLASSVTRATVEKALGHAVNGAFYDLIDPACKGLCLRVTMGSVRWTFRARFGGLDDRSGLVGVAHRPRGVLSLTQRGSIVGVMPVRDLSILFCLATALAHFAIIRP